MLALISLQLSKQRDLPPDELYVFDAILQIRSNDAAQELWTDPFSPRPARGGQVAKSPNLKIVDRADHLNLQLLIGVRLFWMLPSYASSSSPKMMPRHHASAFNGYPRSKSETYSISPHKLMPFLDPRPCQRDANRTVLPDSNQDHPRTDGGKNFSSGFQSF